MADEFDCVVLGGGIAGVSCAEELARLAPAASILLVSASRSLRGVNGIVRVTHSVETFDVVERPIDFLAVEHPNVRARLGIARNLNPDARTLDVQDPETGVVQQVRYRHSCCVATGARPRTVVELDHPRIVTVRDAASVERLAHLLPDTTNVVVVGNGALAAELVEAVAPRVARLCWAVRDSYLGRTFFDASASRFLADCIARDAIQAAAAEPSPSASSSAAASLSSNTTMTATTTTTTAAHSTLGNALGPRWVDILGPISNKTRRRVRLVEVGGAAPDTPSEPEAAHAHAEVTVLTRLELRSAAPAASGRLHALDLTWDDGSTLVDIDLLIVAAGVVPEVTALGIDRTSIGLGDDGGIAVTAQMQSTTHAALFAAGDVASVCPRKDAPNWFQMRLWSQARVMGALAGASMSRALPDTVRGRPSLSDLEIEGGYNMDLFAHCTSVFGRKVVLLGRFNGQGLDEYDAVRAILHRRISPEDTPVATTATAAATATAAVMTDDRVSESADRVTLQVRETPGLEYAKLVIYGDRVVGAMLIGDTDLEEPCEHLITTGVRIDPATTNLLDADLDLDAIMD